MVLLADEEGQAAPLHATELARLLADHPSLRFVFLNACAGATGSDADGIASAAATLVRRGVAAVLAMQYDISDRAAIEFARSFYESLADGLPVDAAVTDARKAVSLAVAHSPEWGTPVLFMQTADGLLFDIEAAPPSEPVAAERSAASSAPSFPAGTTEVAARRRHKRSPPWQWGVLAGVVLLLLLAVIFRQQILGSLLPDAGETLADAPSTIGSTAPSAATTADAEPAPAMPIPSAAVEGDNPVDATVLLYSSLDNMAAITNPTAGIGGFALLDDEQFVPGVEGNGIFFSGRRPFIRFPLEQSGRRNLSLEAGSLEISYRPEYDYLDNQPERNNHILFVVGDVYNPPHFALDFADQVRLSYWVGYDESYYAQAPAGGLWTAGEWIRVRAEWDRRQPQDPLRIFINDQRIDSDRSGGAWPLPEDPGQMNVLYVGAGNANGDLDVTGTIDELVIRGALAAGEEAVAEPTPAP
jgi:hypothetical protein